MNEVTNHQRADEYGASANDEEALLASVLSDSDRLLTDSLREDERRRRRRRLVTLSLLVGGIVMGITVMAVLAGWLTLAAPPPVVAAENKEAWVERIAGLRDHMHTAFGVGPELTLLEPDDGVEIVREAWPKIKEQEVKTGLLKTFAFSKALRPKKHPKLFAVLHLGMTDPDSDVNAYAAGYLKEYAGQDFSRNPEGYSAWYRENKDKTPDEALSAGKSGELPSAEDVERAEELAAEGWQLWKQQKLSDAASLFEQAAKLDPENANVWNGMGWVRLNGGNAKGAITAFEKCVELEPDHPAGLNGLGQAYLGFREYDKAEKFLLKAAPQAPAAHFGLARLYLLTGKYEDAQKWIRKALREQPGDATLKAMMAAARDGKLPDELRRQIEPPKSDGSPTSEAAAEGWRDFNESKFRLAERNFRQALAKDPENAAALNGLGFCLLNNGKAASAKQYFAKCLEIDPEAAGAMNGLARCLKAEGKIDEAIQTWEQMAKKFPGPNAASVGLATTYIEREEFDKALPFAQELVKSAPDNAEFSRLLEAAEEGAKTPKEEAKTKE